MGLMHDKPSETARETASNKASGSLRRSFSPADRILQVDDESRDGCRIP